MLRKLGQNYQLAIPKEIVETLHLEINDYLDVHIQNSKIIIEPQIMVPKDQAYFHTTEWQKDERQADEDIKKSRVTKTKNVKELIKKLRA